MVSQYAVFAAVGALGLVLGLLLSWLWHRAAISKLRGQLEVLEHRYRRLRQNAEVRLEELRARLREASK